MQSVLTGHLSFILLVSAGLTWPISWALIGLYRRALRVSMGKRFGRTAGNGAASDDAEWSAPHSSGPDRPRIADADSFARLLFRRPRVIAMAYGIAGLSYAVAMALALMVGTGLEILPIRSLVFIWTFAWPAALAVAIVAGSTRASKGLILGLYAVVYLILVSVGVAVSPTTTAKDLGVFWILYNLPSTVLLLAALSRRIRAVGPLVLVFLILSLTGADVLSALVGSREAYMRIAVRLGGAMGLGGDGVYYAVLLLGFVIFAALGWLALVWIRDRYDAKRVSDESITLDAMFLLFTIGHAMGLAFEGPGAVLGGPAAFVVYKIAARVALARVGPPDEPHPRLLLLRSFSIGSAEERLFDTVEKHWRRVGSIQLIAGYDLASRTIEPHEFLDFIRGRLPRRFIDSPDALERRVRENDVLPDRDWRFRSNDFFCYDDTWKFVLRRLVQESDAVLMDLRGFSRVNAGCVFEIHELFRIVRLTRVVFVVDRHTDEPLLEATFGAAATQTPSPSGASRPHVRVFDHLDNSTVRQLLDDVASAAAGRETSATH